MVLYIYIHIYNITTKPTLVHLREKEIEREWETKTERKKASERERERATWPSHISSGWYDGYASWPGRGLADCKSVVQLLQDVVITLITDHCLRSDLGLRASWSCCWVDASTLWDWRGSLADLYHKLKCVSMFFLRAGHLQWFVVMRLRALFHMPREYEIFLTDGLDARSGSP